jgi:hypothetical protein
MSIKIEKHKSSVHNSLSFEKNTSKEIYQELKQIAQTPNAIIPDELVKKGTNCLNLKAIQALRPKAPIKTEKKEDCVRKFLTLSVDKLKEGGTEAENKVHDACSKYFNPMHVIPKKPVPDSIESALLQYIEEATEKLSDETSFVHDNISHSFAMDQGELIKIPAVNIKRQPE